MDHLPKLIVDSYDLLIDDGFSDEHLIATIPSLSTLFVDITNHLAYADLPLDLTYYRKKKFFHNIRSYF